MKREIRNSVIHYGIIIGGLISIWKSNTHISVFLFLLYLVISQEIITLRLMKAIINVGQLTHEMVGNIIHLLNRMKAGADKDER